MDVERGGQCPPHTSIFLRTLRSNLEDGAAVEAIEKGAAEIRCAEDISGGIDDYAVGIETVLGDVAEAVQSLRAPGAIGLGRQLDHGTVAVSTAVGQREVEVADGIEGQRSMGSQHVVQNLLGPIAARRGS